MKKRIICALLTLVMIVSLIPASIIPASATDVPYKVKITDDYVNVRDNFSVTGAKVAKVYRDNVVTILEEKSASPISWGKIEYAKDKTGWIPLIYVEEVVSETTSVGSVIATGTVTCGSAVNVRRNPKTTSTKVGSLADGTSVKIYEFTTSNGHRWGRISNGWICMDYVTLDGSESGTTGSNSVVTGTATNANTNAQVVNTESVNVRRNPRVDSTLLTTLAGGTRVHVYETTKTNAVSWARVDQGWICMDYIQMDDGASTSAAVPSANLTVSTGVVSSTVNLNIRSEASSDAAKVGVLTPGSKVVIQKTQVVQGVTWGKIDQGWINLNYVTLDAGSSVSVQAYGVAGTVVNCNNGVNIRSAAGVNNALVGVAPVNSRVVITERTLVKGIYWGRMEKGWVCMDYIKLDAEFVDPVAPEAGIIDYTVKDPAKGYPAKIKPTTADIYAETSIESKVVMTAKQNTDVVVLADTKVGDVTWYRITIGEVTGWVKAEALGFQNAYGRISVDSANAYEKNASGELVKIIAVLKKYEDVFIKDSMYYKNKNYGKVEVNVGGTLVDLWVDLSNITMLPNFKAMNGVTTLLGAGSIVAKTTADLKPFKDTANGVDTAHTIDYTLSSGTQVVVLARTFNGVAEYAKVTVGSTFGWIDMASLKQTEVAMVATDTLTTYTDATLATVKAYVKPETEVTLVERHFDASHDVGTVKIDGVVQYVKMESAPLAAKEETVVENANITIAAKGAISGTIITADTPIYEEASDSSSVLLKLAEDTHITIQSWKKVGSDEWGKVQIGNYIGWIQKSGVDFGGQTGKVIPATVKVYSSAAESAYTSTLKVGGNKVNVDSVVYDGKILWGKVVVLDKTVYVKMDDIALDTIYSALNPNAPAIATGKVNNVSASVPTYTDATFGTAANITIYKNDSVKLIDFKSNGTQIAWKVDMGVNTAWVDMDYLTINPVTAEITSSTKLAIYDTADFGNIVDTLVLGDKITVKGFKNNGGALLGEVSCNGSDCWIVLDDGTSAYAKLTPGATASAGTGETPSATPAPSAPADEKIPATVICQKSVNIRSGAGVNNALVTTLANGTAITIHEQTTVNGIGWARIDQGWICMDYVKFGTGGGIGGSIGQPTVVRSVPAGAIAVGYANEDITIRTGAGYGYGENGKVQKNAAVTIYEKKLDANVIWGRTDAGWIILSYVTLTAIGNSGSMGTIANCGFSANVRGTTNSEGALFGKVMIGSPVAVLDQVTVGTQTWAKTDMGYINMNYVTMTTVTVDPGASTPAETTPDAPAEITEIG